jgi:hypothetical protein
MLNLVKGVGTLLAAAVTVVSMLAMWLVGLMLYALPMAVAIVLAILILGYLVK